jgi:uncharacterized protein
MTDTYKIDVRFSTSVARSKRVVEVAEAFGLGLEDKEFVIFDNLELKIPQGSVVYITGQSGSGKSVLLRELSRQMGSSGKKVINLDEIVFDNTKTLVDQIGTSTNDGLRLMGLAGLNDAYLWIRKPNELSDGQRYRFRLAKAIETGAEVWVADEFMAILDRIAALSIAYSVQKVARRAGATVLVATTHKDLVPDLAPSVYIEKRYREKLRIETFKEIRHLMPDEAYERLLKVM